MQLREFALSTFKKGDTIAAVTKVKKDEDDIEDEELDGVEGAADTSESTEEPTNNKPSSDEEE